MPCKSLDGSPVQVARKNRLWFSSKAKKRPSNHEMEKLRDFCVALVR